MSTSDITVTKLSFNTFEALPAYTACTTDSSLGLGGAFFARVPISSDERLLIMLQNSNSTTAKTIDILKGDQYAAASENLSISAEAESNKIITLESARYSNSGFIIIKADSADIKVAAIRLP